MKINESKQIRMKKDWKKTEIKMDLTKSFSNCPIGDLKLQFYVKYLHNL